MIRTSLFAALVALAATTAATATPYPGTISRIQDNADQMSVSMQTDGERGGFTTDRSQTFGAPQDMRGAFGTETRDLDAASSIRRNSGTSSDRFQDNADTGR